MNLIDLIHHTSLSREMWFRFSVQEYFYKRNYKGGITPLWVIKEVYDMSLISTEKRVITLLMNYIHISRNFRITCLLFAQKRSTKPDFGRQLRQ